MACGTTWGAPTAGTATTVLPRLGQQYTSRRPTAAKGHLERRVESLVSAHPWSRTTSSSGAISTHPREAFLGLQAVEAHLSLAGGTWRSSVPPHSGYACPVIS